MIIGFQKFDFRNPTVSFIILHIMYPVNIFQKNITVAYCHKQFLSTLFTIPIIQIRVIGILAPLGNISYRISNPVRLINIPPYLISGHQLRTTPNICRIRQITITSEKETFSCRSVIKRFLYCCNIIRHNIQIIST